MTTLCPTGRSSERRGDGAGRRTCGGCRDRRARLEDPLRRRLARVRKPGDRGPPRRRSRWPPPAGRRGILQTGRREGKGRPTERSEDDLPRGCRSEEHTSELQSLMRNSYAVFCLKKKKQIKYI